ncbi:hypothetical protein AB0L85_15340 [Streptomyces sp. NPDC052051]|uniref:hypothetical protein n=1 Tax=Streptomyces sp. NPDC052051 TaxID=3154649 RepID=UPI0034402B1A
MTRRTRGIAVPTRRPSWPPGCASAVSLPEILEQLTDRFALLTGGSRVAADRQRTLRALIDWSHELCTERERLLWARASVFRGGFDTESLEQVCTDAELLSEVRGRGGHHRQVPGSPPW